MATNQAYYIAKQRRVVGTTDTLRIAILVGRYFKYLDQINTHPGAMGDAILKTNDKQYTRFQVAYTTPEDVCKYFGNKEVK